MARKQGDRCDRSGKRYAREHGEGGAHIRSRNVRLCSVRACAAGRNKLAYRTRHWSGSVWRHSKYRSRRAVILTNRYCENNRQHRSKQIELARELVPRAAKVGLLANDADPKGPQTRELTLVLPEMKRRHVLAFFQKPPCRVGIEACASSHCWSPRAASIGACGAANAAGLCEALRETAEERHHGRGGNLRSGDEAKQAAVRGRTRRSSNRAVGPGVR